MRRRRTVLGYFMAKVRDVLFQRKMEAMADRCAQEIEAMGNLLRPPWTPEQVEALNAAQRDPSRHPYTCGNNRTDARHTDGEGVLVATPDGWVCPFCDYRQPWCHGADTFRPVSGE